MTLKSLTTWTTKAALAALGIVALAGCQAAPGISGEPIARKFSWFSFVEGGDFRGTCQPGGERYRLIYNGNYEEQMRIYDVVGDGAGGSLEAHVIGQPNLATVEVSEPSDFLDPWRGQASGRDLSAGEMAGLKSDLQAVGAFGAPAVGLELPSNQFFWTVAACSDGAYHFTAFKWPETQVTQMALAKRLVGWDQSPVALNPPRWINPARVQKRSVRYDVQPGFRMRVGENGLWGILR